MTQSCQYGISRNQRELLRITGQTRSCPIIGHPANVVVSPPSINDWLNEHKVDAVMMPLDVPPDALPDFWNLLRRSSTFLGCSVTYPHKRAAYELVDESTPRGSRLHALNTIRRNSDGTLSGDATDGLAVCAAIHARGIGLLDKVAHVVGAGGGAGLAIIDALCEAGIGAVIIEEIDHHRFRQVERLVYEYWPNTRIAQSSDLRADLLINASPLGAQPSDIIPFSNRDIGLASCVCDIVGASNTPLLQAARHELDKPCVIDGRLVGQMQVKFQMGFICDRESELRE